MTGRTLFQHFIKLVFLWGFLHFCWNEQVSMHDLFCNELWWIFLSTLKWVASSGNLKKPPCTYGSKLADAHVRKWDNREEGSVCVCVYVYIILSVIILNCLQHSRCLLKVRYCVEFKILLCWAERGRGEIKHFLNWAQISKVNFLRKLQPLDKAIPCKLVLPAWITAKFMQLALSFQKRLWSVVINWHT